MEREKALPHTGAVFDNLTKEAIDMRNMVKAMVPTGIIRVLVIIALCCIICPHVAADNETSENVTAENVTAENATIAVTPTPEAAVTQSADSTPSATQSPAPEQKKDAPCFEAVFAIAGLLAVAYLIRRKD